MYEQRRTFPGTIKRGLLALPAASRVAAGLLFNPGPSQADAGTCHQWHAARQSSQLIATGDIYRVCDGRLEILIIEDDHRTLVTHVIN